MNFVGTECAARSDHRDITCEVSGARIFICQIYGTGERGWAKSSCKRSKWTIQSAGRLYCTARLSFWVWCAGSENNGASKSTRNTSRWHRSGWIQVLHLYMCFFVLSRKSLFLYIVFSQVQQPMWKHLKLKWLQKKRILPI